MPPTVAQVAQAKGTVVPDVGADVKRTYRFEADAAAASAAAYVPGASSSSSAGPNNDGLFQWMEQEDNPKT